MNKSVCRSEKCFKTLSGKRKAMGFCVGHDSNKQRTCCFEDCVKKLRSDNQRGYCQKHAWNSPDVKDYYSKYYIDNKERICDVNKKWGLKNPGKRQKISRQWDLDNPERVRELKRKREQTRRARKKGAFVEVVDPMNLWRRDSGLCFLCGYPSEKEKWEVAHIIPLSRGGEHSYRNTATSHPYCNGKQLAKLLDTEFDSQRLWEEFQEGDENFGRFKPFKSNTCGGVSLRLFYS